MKREDEEICKDAFNKYLNLRFDSNVISWEEISQENEPPDYFMKLNGETFAVEVTQIMVTRNFDSKKISHLSAIKFLLNLVKEIKKNSDSFLNGSYYLNCSDLLINYNYVKDSRGILIERVGNYISDTRDLASAPDKIILQKGYNNLFTIKKVNNLKNEIVPLPIDFFNAGSVMEDVYSLIKNSMIEKVHKLSKINKPKILLLYDNYGIRSEVFSEESDKENLIIFLDKNIMGFHTVFWVYNDRDGFVLYSEEFN